MLPAMLASPTTVPNPFSIRSAPAFRATLRSMPPLRVMLSLRVLVATFAALVLVPIASAGCPHQGGELEVLPPLSTTDEDADRLLREADRAADEGRVDEAAARYREIVARHGDDRIAPLAHLGLGRLAVGLGRFDEAITELDRAGQGDAVVAERAALYRGVALHLSGRSADAVPVLAPLLGHTTDPEETRLLLDTLATAALATEQHVMALGALDARLDATEERERPEVLERIREIASRRLRDDQIDLAYDTLRRSGHAWRHVAERALRRAHDTGDLERVRAIAADLTDRGIPLDGALATLVSRAERIAQADVRVIGAILPLSGPAREIGQRALRGLMLAAGTPGHGPQPPDAPLLVFRDDASDPRACGARRRRARVGAPCGRDRGSSRSRVRGGCRRARDRARRAHALARRERDHRELAARVSSLPDARRGARDVARHGLLAGARGASRCSTRARAGGSA
jgi:tetratricopeptide (TPR) repeat protein